MRWLDPLKLSDLFPTTALLIAAPLLLSACSSGNSGMVCEGKVETLSGQVLGNTEGKIIDRFTSFHVTMDKLKLESGELYSSNPQQYIPSAVTREGWLAQRLSDTRFSVINAQQDRMITFSCPARAI
ncbi:hypothetical protein J3D56_001227 [Erwinia persicina]|jgi:hypothetical protein|uniref:Lysozyme inhibitor n=2 Tax=Erwinia TaxID=551 RepID=A0ABV4E535_9GAMM|nr:MULTISPECIES: hypothetical protein [Erwinia]MCP1437791.1 hypothetical protein [Erwinia persicina]MDN4628340.1 hypothetical protein [Erwinia sp. PsM31]MDN8541151.1 hypothetical protein [Erwinia sp. BC051422]